MNISELISFTSESINFDLDNQSDISTWIENCCSEEDKVLGQLSYIFCSDEYLLEMNKKYLHHDTFTDIITFNYCEDDTISGDIFISVDRVKENAAQFEVTFQKELSRVIVHGVLHLLGYNDKSKGEKLIMRSKEDFYLSLLPI